jgi:Na+-translocating ferredoxin:NAD+ oxidoreductase RnfD subunit
MSIVNPFLRNGPRSSNMAVWALIALFVPSSIYSVLYHTPFIFHLVGYTLLGALLEGIYLFLRNGTFRLNNISSGLTAALIAASVPASMPFLPMLFALIVAIWLVKLPNKGNALRFNAAMAGRLFLMMAYSNEIVAWGNPEVDVLSSATPQELYASEGFAMELPSLLFGRTGGNWEELFLLVPGSPGETFPIILLLIGAILCIKGIVAWRAPVAFLLSFSVASMALGDSALFNLFSSATIFSAVFIVSDPISTPLSKSGKIITGILIGVSNALLRHYTYYTEAIVFAVLIGNLFAPMLDRAAFKLQGLKLHKRMINP